MTAEEKKFFGFFGAEYFPNFCEYLVNDLGSDIFHSKERETDLRPIL